MTTTRTCARHGEYGGPYCLVCGYTGDDQPAPSPSSDESPYTGPVTGDVYMGAASVHPTTPDEEALKVVNDVLCGNAEEIVAALRRAGWPFNHSFVRMQQQLDEARSLLRRIYDECMSGRVPPVELDCEDEVADFLGLPRSGPTPGSLADRLGL